MSIVEEQRKDYIELIIHDDGTFSFKRDRIQAEAGPYYFETFFFSEIYEVANILKVPPEIVGKALLEYLRRRKKKKWMEA